MIYVDSSALVKLVVAEPESAPLRDLLDTAQQPLVASSIIEIELVRAVRRSRSEPLLQQAHRVVSHVTTIELADTIRQRAALLDPPQLRTLDAIHLATALELEDELTALVTYDTRLSQAAERYHITVLAPRT